MPCSGWGAVANVTPGARLSRVAAPDQPEQSAHPRVELRSESVILQREIPHTARAALPKSTECWAEASSRERRSYCPVTREWASQRSCWRSPHAPQQPGFGCCTSRQKNHLHRCDCEQIALEPSTPNCLWRQRQISRRSWGTLTIFSLGYSSYIPCRRSHRHSSTDYRGTPVRCVKWQHPLFGLRRSVTCRYCLLGDRKSVV